MNDAVVGRLLVASLHQAIADLLPTRLEFYEAWLNPGGLREGRIGLAPLAAVLSFLRLEGEPYHLITARAGEYTAEWSSPRSRRCRKRIIHAAPPAIRKRLVIGMARFMARSTYGATERQSAVAAVARRGGPAQLAVLRGPRPGRSSALRVLCVGAAAADAPLRARRRRHHRSLPGHRRARSARCRSSSVPTGPRAPPHDRCRHVAPTPCGGVRDGASSRCLECRCAPAAAAHRSRATAAARPSSWCRSTAKDATRAATGCAKRLRSS